jgi:hypothetical protein
MAANTHFRAQQLDVQQNDVQQLGTQQTDVQQNAPLWQVPIDAQIASDVITRVKTLSLAVREMGDRDDIVLAGRAFDKAHLSLCDCVAELTVSVRDATVFLAGAAQASGADPKRRFETDWAFAEVRQIAAELMRVRHMFPAAKLYEDQSGAVLAARHLFEAAHSLSLAINYNDDD